MGIRLGRPRRAEGTFRRAIESISERGRRAEVMLYLAWALDLDGRRLAAKHLYKRVRDDPHAPESARSRARYHRWFRFDSSKAADLNIDFTYGGVP
jgi:hypothetical protein